MTEPQMLVLQTALIEAISTHRLPVAAPFLCCAIAAALLGSCLCELSLISFE